MKLLGYLLRRIAMVKDRAELKERAMRFLWYTLSVLLLIGGISAIMKESLSGARGIGFVIGALFLPVVFFLLGRRASKIAARTKAQKQQQPLPPLNHDI